MSLSHDLHNPIFHTIDLPLYDKNASSKDLKLILDETKTRLTHYITTGRNRGYEAACYLSGVMDSLLVTIFHQKIPVYLQEKLAIIAIGGYGRGTLAPYSDIDILILIEETQEECNNAIMNALYDIWDLKITLGYCVQTVPDAMDKAKQDFDFRTALLENRLIFGSDSLYQKLMSDYHILQHNSGLEFLSCKMQERQERHYKSGDSRYLVEPDLKNGKGGLRDLHSLFWIGKYLYHVQTAQDLIDHHVFSKSDLRTVRNAEKFLWTVRFMVHHFSKRSNERVSFDIQQNIAKALGYKDSKNRPAVEHFMKHYFIVARNVGHITRIFCHALEAQHRMRSKYFVDYFKDMLGSYKLNEKHFYIHDDRIDFMSDKAVVNTPLLLIEIFYIADMYNIAIHPEAMKTIRKDVHLINDVFRQTAEPYMMFRKILCHGKHTEKTLRDMNEAGILGRLIPDFGHIVALMQFNMYHHYTVDEHLIRTVGVVQKIAQGTFKAEHPLASNIINTLEMRDILFLSALLHDMAKGRKEDHSVAGARIARELAPKMGFSRAETDILEWLVLHHLVMSEISQKRDLSDENVIKDFAKFVQSSQRLKLLLCLTVADIRAVGPDVWNGWKGELLRTLYNRTQEFLQGGYILESRLQRTHITKQKFLKQIKDIPYDGASFIAEELPSGFWLNTDIMIQNLHIALIYHARQAGKETSIALLPDIFRSVTDIAVYTTDYPGLFTTLVGVLSSIGTYIYDAKIYTAGGGWAIDHFRIQDISGKAIIDPDHLKRIEKNLLKAIENKQIDFQKQKDIQISYCEKSQNIFNIATAISFDNHGSITHNILEIATGNRYFLLYDIAFLLHRMKISISSAHINTYGEKAVYVFYIKNCFGFKMRDTSLLTKIKKNILSLIDNSYSP